MATDRQLLSVILAAAIASVASSAPKAGSAPAATAAAPADGAPARDDRHLAAAVERRLEARLPLTAHGIRVASQDGRITLTGEIDILPRKRLATEAAESVPGVQAVTNNLRVNAAQHSDEEIARLVRGALQSDPATFALDLHVSVRDGVVQLRGRVEAVPQRRLAEWVVSGLVGVRDVVNQIEVDPIERNDAEIAAELARHYAASPSYNDDDISVRVGAGVVRLSGHVDSALEKNWARQEAWVPGVKRVEVDRLRVRRDTPATTSKVEPAKPLSDEDVRESILRAFVYDPRVASAKPQVAVADGVVTLGGSVSNRRARTAALEIARHTGGVRRVVDRLEIDPGPPRTDADVTEDVRRALRSSAALADEMIEVTVVDGRATLAGTVDTAYEDWVATDLAGRIVGVREIENRLRIGGDGAAREWNPIRPRGETETPLITVPGHTAVRENADLARKAPHAADRPDGGKRSNAIP